MLESLEQARKWLQAAKSVVLLTGAGISAESGIPTFRGARGLWRNFRPEELATPEAFSRDPAMVWEWYNWRRTLIAQAQPNSGHRAIATVDCTVITQNVDGLHQSAGSKRVLEVHGSIWRLRCVSCGLKWDDYETPIPNRPPKCRCGGMARPGVVWFGENLPPGIWSAAEDAVESADVLIVAGTSAVVYPAAGLIPAAAAAGTKVIEVNIEATAVSTLVDCLLVGKCGEILPELLR